MPTDSRKKINYINRDFTSSKQDLLEFAKQIYGDRYQDFSEASIPMMMLEMAAHVSDLLSYHLDNKYNEIFLDTAKSKESVIGLAKNLGYDVRGKRAAATLVNVEITVPTTGTTFDSDYALTYQKGMRLQSESGVIFEILEDVNFNSAYSFDGNKNREIIPQIE